MQSGEGAAFRTRTAGLILTLLDITFDLIEDDAIAEVTGRSIGDVEVTAVASSRA